MVAGRIATLGISQADYATKMGVERSVLHNVLSGKAKLPREPFRRRLADDLGISVLEIFQKAGELTKADIEPVVRARRSPRVESLCSLVEQIDWDWRPEQYDDLTMQLNRWAERDKVRRAASISAQMEHGKAGGASMGPACRLSISQPKRLGSDIWMTVWSASSRVGTFRPPSGP